MSHAGMQNVSAWLLSLWMAAVIFTLIIYCWNLGQDISIFSTLASSKVIKQSCTRFAV